MFCALEISALPISALALGCGGVSTEAREPDEEPRSSETARLRGEATCTTEGAPGIAEQAAAVALEVDDPARLAAHEAACSLGNLCGCDSVAQYLEPTDPERARALFTDACEAGLQVSCVNLGIALRDGVGGDADPERAAQLFATACEAGAPWGCANHADTIASAGTREVTLAALSHYATACDGGIPWGCYRVATDTLEVSNDPSLRVDAHRFATFACESGLAAACTHRGRLLASGWGVDAPDPSAAFAQFTRACEGDEAWGCTFLGQALLGGLGTTRDAARGTELLTRACDGGNAVACRSLAGTLDAEARAERLARACELRDAQSCDAIALPPRTTEIPAALAGDASAVTHTPLDARGAAVVLELDAGGDVDVSSLDLRPSCVGRVASAPTAIVVVPRRVTHARFRLATIGDSTLVVRGPDGIFHCADDADGGTWDADLTVPVRAGEVQIWTGVAEDYVVFGRLTVQAVTPSRRAR